MSEPMSDAQIGVEILKQVMAFFRSHQPAINGLIDGTRSASMTTDYWDLDLFERISPLFAARLATAEADRDAALAAFDHIRRAAMVAQAEGERRATAAIVAWLKQGGATSWTTEAIERGDHLPSAGDVGEGA